MGLGLGTDFSLRWGLIFQFCQARHHTSTLLESLYVQLLENNSSQNFRASSTQIAGSKKSSQLPCFRSLMPTNQLL